MPGHEYLKKSVISFSKALCALPEKPGRALACAMGLIAWQGWRSERARMEDTIDRVYFRLNKKPVMPVSEIVKKAFIHFSLNIYELLRYPVLTKETITARIHFSGEDLLKEQMAAKKGIILALPHIGNWEMLGAAIAAHEYPLNSFFMAQKEDEVGGLLDYFRTFSGIKLHDRDRGGVKALKALKGGECLGMITDQDGSQSGVYVTFLGHTVSMPAGPANWSIKTGAALMPVYSVRRGFTAEFDAGFLPPIVDDGAGTHAERVVKRTQSLVNWMEELIFKYPHQYLWFYNRFKPRHEAWLTAEKQRRGQIYHGETRYGV